MTDKSNRNMASKPDSKAQALPSLTDFQKKIIKWVVSVLFIAVLAFLGVTEPGDVIVPPFPAEQAAEIVQLGTTNLSDLELSGDLSVGDDTTLTDDASVGGDLTVSGDLTLDDTFNIDEVTSVVTGAVTLVPTATYYQFAPSSVLTLTISTTGALQGDFLILHNTVTTSTTVVDTGATVGGGVVTLGANDLAIFIYGNSKWIEVASPDNS